MNLYDKMDSWLIAPIGNGVFGLGIELVRLANDHLMRTVRHSGNAVRIGPKRDMDPGYPFWRLWIYMARVKNAGRDFPETDSLYDAPWEMSMY